MITFLWMLFLAFTIFKSTITIVAILDTFIKKNHEDEDNKETAIFKIYLVATSSILWSIWYMYFLH